MNRPWLLALVLLVLDAGPVAAAPPGDPSAPSLEEVWHHEEKIAWVEDMSLEFATMQATIARQSDALDRLAREGHEKEVKAIAALAAKDAELRDKISTLHRETRARQRLQTQLDAVTAERKKAVEQLARVDAKFAAEIAEYRRQVASLAESTDPRKIAALKAYAAGDRAVAFETLVAIQKAETVAVGAGWRQIGTLALEMNDRGELSASRALEVWRYAAQLEDSAEAWAEVGALSYEVGELQRSNLDYQMAASRAVGGPGKLGALIGVGQTALALGEVDQAKVAFSQAVQIARDELLRRPTDPDAKLDLSRCLRILGRIRLELGDLSGATKAVEESEQIARDVVKAQPENVRGSRYVALALADRGDLEVQHRDLDAARRSYDEAVTRMRAIAQADAVSVLARRELADMLLGACSVAFHLDQLDRAGELCRESVTLLQSLANMDPGSARAARDLAIALNHAGDVAFMMNDMPAAARNYQLSVDARQYALRSGQDDNELQIELAGSYERLGNAYLAQKKYPGAAKSYELALGIVRQVVADKASSQVATHQLVQMLMHTGSLALVMGDIERARSDLGEALGLLDALILTTPDAASYQEERGIIVELLSALPSTAPSP